MLLNCRLLLPRFISGSTCALQINHLLTPQPAHRLWVHQRLSSGRARLPLADLHQVIRQPGGVLLPPLPLLPADRPQLERQRGVPCVHHRLAAGLRVLV